jgi:prephenate dehydrogenase
VRPQHLGIIGFGRFGQLVAHYLRGILDILVYDIEDRSAKAREQGVKWATAEECAACDAVVFAVPISKFEGSLTALAPHFTEGAIIIEVCSVKEGPIAAMERFVPEHCSCIGTHPLFGPDSASTSLEGRLMAICPVRTRPGELERFIDFLRAFGIVPMVVEPAEHDRQMAHSLTLVHFLGKSLEDIDVECVELKTPTHDMFLKLVAIVRNDSHELMLDIHRHNRYARQVRRDLIKDMQRIDAEIEGV